MHKLYRSKTDKILFGVCGGLAEYFEIDSVLVRLVLILFSLMGGGGVLLYLVLVLVIPKNPVAGTEADAKEKIKEFAHKTGETVGDLAKEIGEGAKTSAESFKEKRGGRRTSFFGVLLVVLGLLLLANEFMPAYWMMGRRFFWPALIMLLGFYLIFRKPNGKSHTSHSREDRHQ